MTTPKDSLKPCPWCKCQVQKHYIGSSDWCFECECAEGDYLLASDIDAEHLKTAINALTAVAIFDRFSDKPKEAINHLSALLAAVRKV